jgi:hypothetical protein
MLPESALRSALEKVTPKDIGISDPAHRHTAGSDPDRSRDRCAVVAGDSFNKYMREQSAPDTPFRGSETILLVEDEAPIRKSPPWCWSVSVNSREVFWHRILLDIWQTQSAST